MEPFPNDHENPCFGFIKILEKNVTSLELEYRHCSRVIEDLEQKLETFNKISTRVSDTLQSLWSLSDSYHQTNNIKGFADKMSACWILASKQVADTFYKIKIASRTIPDIPLSVLLDKIKKESATVKISLQIGEVLYNREQVFHGYTLYHKVTGLIKTFDQCDNKIQQYLAVSRMTAHLFQIESEIMKFIAVNELLPVTLSTCNDLSVFPIVMKLLTGELLYQVTTDPHQVLADNTPKKPVFIIKRNTKKKTKLLSEFGGDISIVSTKYHEL